MHALPVMDLLALVLIIPLLSSVFTPEEGIIVELPETSFRMQRVDRPIVVTVAISKNGPEVLVGRNRIGKEKIEDVLIRAQSTWEGSGIAPVFLKVDKNISSGVQLEYLDRIKSAGFQKIYLAGQAAR